MCGPEVAGCGGFYRNNIGVIKGQWNRQWKLLSKFCLLQRLLLFGGLGSTTLLGGSPGLLLRNKKIRYYNKETLLRIMYPYDGNLK